MIRRYGIGCWKTAENGSSLRIDLEDVASIGLNRPNNRHFFPAAAAIAAVEVSDDAEATRPERNERTGGILLAAVVGVEDLDTGVAVQREVVVAGGVAGDLDRVVAVGRDADRLDFKRFTGAGGWRGETFFTGVLIYPEVAALNSRYA